MEISSGVYYLDMNSKTSAINSWLGTGSINLFGPPFAGKDTQGKLLAEALGGELVAGGDILRSYPDQEKIKQLMSTGELFPTDFYLGIVLPYLSKHEFTGKPLILSSVGRLHGEEPSVIEATNNSGHPIKAVVQMLLSEEEIWKRFEASRQQNDRGERADDHTEVLMTRIKKYKEKTLPVIEYYRERNLVLEVDGNQSRQDVTQSIIKALYTKIA